MTTFYSRIYKLLTILFFLLNGSALQAQSIELSKYYQEKIAEKDFPTSKKEQLIDSLLRQKNIKIDTSKAKKKRNL